MKRFMYLTLLAPMALILLIIAHYGVNFVYSDEWIMAPVFQHIDSGIVSYHDFWQMFSYHRLFFGKILITLSAYLTHWNTKVEMLLSFGFCLITLLFIYLMIRRSIRNKGLIFLSMFIATYWLFSPVLSENWLWGWEVIWFMGTAGAIASIYFLSRKRLNVAIISGVFSTYSFGWGQSVWPIGLLMMIIQRRKRKPILTWSGAGILTLGAYYFHFSVTGNTPPPPVLAFLHHPLNAALYYLVIFGRPFTNDLYPAMTFGAVSLLILIPVLGVVWEKRKDIDKYLAWLGMILLSLIGALMIIMGRLNHDYQATTPLTDALQSRYTAVSILYIIGLSGLIISLLDSLKLNKKLLKYAVVTILVIQIPLLYSSYWIGINTSRDRYVLMKRLQSCSNQVLTKDCLSSNDYLNTNQVAKEQLQYLKDKHWAGY